MITAFLPVAALALLSLLGATAPVPTPQRSDTGIHWPSFRGLRARGVAEGFATPVRWSAETSENVAWKTPIPGLGHSSPVVWGDRVFVTTAISERDNSLRAGLYGNITPVEDDSVHTWKVYCLDKDSGEILWERTAHRGVPEIKRHTKSTHANPTVATDGQRVVAMFGSEGLFVYDVDGELLWQKDFGVLDSGFFMVPEAQWGFASSPVIFEGTIIVQADVQEGSFLAALAIEDGDEVWRTPRGDVPTFGTPTVYEVDGRAIVVVNGYRHIGGYDARSGEEIWRLEGGGDIPAPTPIVAHGLVFITNAHGGQSPIFAVRATARGDVTPAGDPASSPHLAWSREREGAYMPTPIVYGDHLYVVRDTGVLGVYEARTGEEIYRNRLGTGGAFTASPVAADGKVYFTSEEGDVYVVRAGPQFEVLATNSIGEVTLASPAVSEGMLLFRTQHHVMAIGDR